MESIAFQKIAVFPTDERGRHMISVFQDSNRIVTIAPGEMVNDTKKEPALWVLYVPGQDPYIEQAPKKKKLNNDHLRKSVKTSSV